MTHKTRDGYSKNGWKRSSSKLAPEGSASIECSRRSIKNAGATPNRVAQAVELGAKITRLPREAGDAAVEHIEQHRQKDEDSGDEQELVAGRIGSDAGRVRDRAETARRVAQCQQRGKNGKDFPPADQTPATTPQLR
jgi:hypothetical protein